MKRVEVLAPFRHGGRLYGPGTVAVLPGKTVAALAEADPNMVLVLGEAEKPEAGKGRGK